MERNQDLKYGYGDHNQSSARDYLELRWYRGTHFRP
jgi:hypothetical protein